MLNCDCPQKCMDTLKEAHGSPVDLHLQLYVDRKDPGWKTVMHFTPILYSYMKGKKKVRSYLKMNYCCLDCIEKGKAEPLPSPKKKTFGILRKSKYWNL